MNGWKITAIIFIVLFLLETGLIVWSVSMYNQQVENEESCIYDICDVGNTYENYYFDSMGDICYCYLDDEVALTKRIK
jgi:predicted P-loop ATPase/GTPase